MEQWACVPKEVQHKAVGNSLCSYKLEVKTECACVSKGRERRRQTDGYDLVSTEYVCICQFWSVYLCYIFIACICYVICDPCDKTNMHTENREEGQRKTETKCSR